MMNQTDLERFQPECWDQIVGNVELKEYFRDLLHCVRIEGHRSGFNLLATGESRTGKTVTIKYGIKCLGCIDLDYESLNACGTCKNCVQNYHLFGNNGCDSHIFLHDSQNSIRYSLIPIDCANLKESEIDDLYLKLRVEDDSVRVVYLDEVHRLSRRFMDEKLLKPIEDFSAIWIASSANLSPESSAGKPELDVMFQNRFSYRLRTEKPSVDEMTQWLAIRCDEFGIRCDTPKATLRLLAERSNQVTGLALQVLNRAFKKRKKLLTEKIVAQHIFSFSE